MKEFAFSLATPADDEAILKLLRDNPVPGKITIGYERAPSYFHGCHIMGHLQQTLVVRHLPSGQLAGLAGRTARQMYVNGREQEVGYLGQLRVDQRFRSRWLVSGGFRFLRQLHEERPAHGYITTIIDGNREALGVLVQRPRQHFPLYREIDRLHTLALPARLYRPHKSDRPEIELAGQNDITELVTFYGSHGPEKQFFPLLQAADFLPGASSTRGLRSSDFLLAKKGGQICGAMGLWDQSAYKQTIVRGYSGPLHWGRRLYNGLAICRGERPLPPPGEALSLAYAAFVCIAGNDPEIYRQLLERVCSLATERGYGRVLVGLTARDPLLAVAGSFPHLPYVSRLYTACWKGEGQFHDQLDGRICHVEIATI